MIDSTHLRQLLGTASDEEIVARVRAGERDLYEVLVRRHNERLYRVVRSILTSEADVEDAMQEAYVRAYQHLAQFDGRGTFAGWLRQIAAREALGRLRRRAIEPTSTSPAPDGSMDDYLAPAALPDESADQRELRLLIGRVVDDLPAGLRSVFVLREVERLPAEEVAQTLGISNEAMRVRLHRARRALRERLERKVGGLLVELYPFHLARCDRIVARVFERIDHPA